jgi:hypothetical protein
MGGIMITDAWQDLIVSVLSVGGYTTDRLSQIADEIQALGLFDPELLVALPPERVTFLLTEAGYQRGERVTRMMADRLCSLATQASLHGIARFEATISTGTTEEVTQLLLPMSGIGPFVIETFLALRKDT